MIAILLLFLAGALALALVRFLPVKLYRGEWLALSTVLALFLLAWLSFLFVVLAGYQWGIGWLIVLMTIASVWLWRQPAKLEFENQSWFSRPWAKVLGWSVIIFWAIFLGYLAYIKLLSTDNGNLMSGGYTWADLALHQTLASFFREQPHFNLDFSIYVGNTLNYPFLSDFLSAILARTGLSWQLAFLLPTLALLWSWSYLVIAVFRRLVNKAGAAVLYYSLLLTSGSFAGVWYFYQNLQTQGWTAYKSFDYANLNDAHSLVFANLVNSHLLPQRSYLFGVAVAWTVFLLFDLWYRKQKKPVFALLLILVAGLPLIHVHSFLVLLGFLGLYTLGQIWHKSPKVQIPYWYYLILLLGLAQLGWQAAIGLHSEFMRVQIGWMTPPDQTVSLFWFRNLGLFFPIVAVMFIPAIKQSVYYTRYLLILGVIIFLACNLISFQPYAWDNMKFMTYGYSFLLLPVVLLLVWLWQRWWGILPVLLLVFSMSASGVLALTRETKVQYIFVSPEDQEVANYIREHTPKDAVILVSDRHNHPVSMLAGRRIVLGYGGWLWSYGIDTTDRGLAVQRMFRASDGFGEDLARYQVQYVVVQDQEKAKLNFNEPYYQTHFVLQKRLGSWDIYQVGTTK